MTEPTVQNAGVAWRFYLLGELQVEYQGRAVPPAPYRTHSLLAALLLRPRPLARERLIGMLFPDLTCRNGPAGSD
jgi:DNA-binding SARP family transcriptional activator